MRNRIVALTAALAIAVPALAGMETSAPAFTLTARGGGDVSLQQYHGQVVMINFWASLCGPCRTEMPLLDSIYRKYNKLGFTLLGVNVEPDSQAADEWLRQTPVSFPILYDKESKVSKLYDVAGMPSTVIIDRGGELRQLR